MALMIAETGMTAGEIILIITACSAAAVTIIGAGAAGIVTIMNVRKQRDDEIALKKAYAGIANEAIQAYAANENAHRARAGKPLVDLPAAVVAEGSSPPKPLQQEQAALATMRAHMAMLKVETGQPPRKEPNGADIAAAPLVEVLDTIKTDAAALAEKIEAAKKLAGASTEAGHSTPVVGSPVKPIHPEPLASIKETVEDTNERVQSLEEDHPPERHQ